MVEKYKVKTRIEAIQFTEKTYREVIWFLGWELEDWEVTDSEPETFLADELELNNGDIVKIGDYIVKTEGGEFLAIDTKMKSTIDKILW